MMTFDDKVGGWGKKGQNHDDVILEWSLYHDWEISCTLHSEINIAPGTFDKNSKLLIIILKKCSKNVLKQKLKTDC